MPGSLGTVSSQYGSRIYLVMSQQKSCEEEYAVRWHIRFWGCFLGTFSKAYLIAVGKALMCSL